MITLETPILRKKFLVICDHVSQFLKCRFVIFSPSFPEAYFNFFI
jgi:hypothetical protein